MCCCQLAGLQPPLCLPPPSPSTAQVAAHALAGNTGKVIIECLGEAGHPLVAALQGAGAVALLLRLLKACNDGSLSSLLPIP